MVVIARATLRVFRLGHPAAEGPLMAWYQETREADWSNSQELRRTFGSASILKRGRVVFNVKGNDYRLVAFVNYRSRTVYVKFVGTHSEYDRIDANTIGGTGKKKRRG